jgi:hypothetical protein
MPKFSKEDFTQENASRLMVIIMSKMGRPPLTQFRDLLQTQQTKFNRLMNEYIADLGEDWNTKLTADFDLIVNEDILNEEFDPSKVFVRDTIAERKVLLSQQEQEEWIKDETERSGVAPIY